MQSWGKQDYTDLISDFLFGGEGVRGTMFQKLNEIGGNNNHQNRINACSNCLPAIIESPQNPDAQPIRTVLPCKGFDDMNRLCWWVGQ